MERLIHVSSRSGLRRSGASGRMRAASLRDGGENQAIQERPSCSSRVSGARIEEGGALTKALISRCRRGGLPELLSAITRMADPNQPSPPASQVPKPDLACPPGHLRHGAAEPGSP